MSEEFNSGRACFVLGKIDEILSWEKTKEREKDARFVELGEYLCEVRAKQYWRLEKLQSFDELTSKSRGYCLQMICADFLAGANLDGANPEALILSLRQTYRLLPPEQQNQFRHEIAG